MELGNEEKGTERFWREGQRAWPDVQVSLAELTTHLARHTKEGGELPPLERAGDVYLVAGCVLLRPSAVAGFDKVLSACVARSVARVDASPSFADLVTQDLRARLLMGSPPKVSEYGGRAALATWLKTAAIRAALNHRRNKADQIHDALASNLVAVEQPELQFIRERYRTEFEEAVRAALTGLPERERSLLHASVGQGKTIDDLGAEYGVSRATAARWVAAARETLAKDTRARLIDRLGMTPEQLDSVAGVVMSQIDVSIVRLLGGG